MKDPRRTTKGNHQHALTDIILLVISAVICGAGDWDEIELFGTLQRKWLKKHGSFKNGIPSHDTINRVMSAIDPKMFSKCFSDWVQGLSSLSRGEVVAIDGKRIKGSYDTNSGKSAIHMVSAFATTNGVCLGQTSTYEKSNEITAIPELLNNLILRGSTITIDAMGCQTAIAEKIIEKKADYILAVKGNQGSLEQGIKDIVRFEKPVDSHIETDIGHGRIENRTCRVFKVTDHIENKDKWVKLNHIIEIQAERIIKASGEKSTETRYYITSKKATAQVFNSNIRSHWAIENKLHWALDVTFGEDASRKRQKYAAENFNTVAKIALTLLANEKTVKASKKSKRLGAAIDTKFREKILNL